MSTCQAMTKDGRPCSRPVKAGARYCWQHQPDQPASRPEDHQPLWTLAILISLPFLFSYVMILWYRWLRPDPQFLTFSANIAQLVALVSLLGLTTDWGRQAVSRLVDAIDLRSFITSWVGCLVAWGAVVTLAALFHVGSPAAARFFNQRGAAALLAGRPSIAIRSLQQSVSLDPDNASAHYNLGNAYESLQSLDEAIAEYQLALALNDNLWQAANNLSRLYLRVHHDPLAALTVLSAAAGRTSDPEGQGVIDKTIGRAHLEADSPDTALETLDRAIGELRTLAESGHNVAIHLADAYRLEALAYEALGQPVEASRAWTNCLGYALSILESEPCARDETASLGHSGSTGPACLEASQWAAEAHKQVTSLSDTEGGE